MTKKEQVYNKLIRDKIPQIIKDDGWQPALKKLSDKDYLKELKKKMVEEAEELNEAKSKDDIINELADIKEIVDSLIKYYDFDKKTIDKKQNSKRKERGGFKKKLFLIKNVKK